MMTKKALLQMQGFFYAHKKLFFDLWPFFGNVMVKHMERADPAPRGSELDGSALDFCV